MLHTRHVLACRVPAVTNNQLQGKEEISNNKILSEIMRYNLAMLILVGNCDKQWMVNNGLSVDT